MRDAVTLLVLMRFVVRPWLASRTPGVLPVCIETKTRRVQHCEYLTSAQDEPPKSQSLCRASSAHRAEVVLRNKASHSVA